MERRWWTIRLSRMNMGGQISRIHINEMGRTSFSYFSEFQRMLQGAMHMSTEDVPAILVGWYQFAGSDIDVQIVPTTIYVKAANRKGSTPRLTSSIKSGFPLHPLARDVYSQCGTREIQTL